MNNPNFVQNPMYNQMNQINMQNQMNPINIQNHMNLINMQNQMNQMLMNFHNQLKEDYYEDRFSYIKEDRKKIKFIRVLDNKLFKVKVPCSLRKNELYYTANNYKMFEFSKMQLFHKKGFLNEDETSIDCINDDDEIKIIEEIDGVDFSYYEVYLSKHKNEPKINIFFYLCDGKKKGLALTQKTSIEEMSKILFNEINVPENNRNDFILLFNGSEVNISEKSSLEKNNIINGMSFSVIRRNMLDFKFCEGKIMEVLIIYKNNIKDKTYVGTLVKVKDFYDRITIFFPNIKISKITINGKEIEKNDERTLSSIGIRDNFSCYIESQ